MARTVIDLDTEALEEAAEVLGTRTTVDTVNTAPREIANRARRLAYVKALADGDTDLGEETLQGAWHIALEL